MKNRRVIYVFICLFVGVYGCKPKTELYLERGIDILSNKEEVHFEISPSIVVNEIGVIRDQKENKKTLVFKLNDSIQEKEINPDYILGIRVWIYDKSGNKRIEDWDLQPEVVVVNDFNYFLKEISIQENQIHRMKIYGYTVINGKKHKQGDELTIHKLNTYND